MIRSTKWRDAHPIAAQWSFRAMSINDKSTDECKCVWHWRAESATSIYRFRAFIFISIAKLNDSWIVCECVCECVGLRRRSCSPSKYSRRTRMNIEHRRRTHFTFHKDYFTTFPDGCDRTSHRLRTVSGCAQSSSFSPLPVSVGVILQRAIGVDGVKYQHISRLRIMILSISKITDRTVARRQMHHGWERSDGTCASLARTNRTVDCRRSFRKFLVGMSLKHMTIQRHFCIFPICTRRLASSDGMRNARQRVTVSTSCSPGGCQFYSVIIIFRMWAVSIYSEFRLMVSGRCVTYGQCHQIMLERSALRRLP